MYYQYCKLCGGHSMFDISPPGIHNEVNAKGVRKRFSAGGVLLGYVVAWDHPSDLFQLVDFIMF